MRSTFRLFSILLILFGLALDIATVAAQGGPGPATMQPRLWIPQLYSDYRALTVDPQDRQASLDFYTEVYLASENVDMGWTGSRDACDPGDTAASFKRAVRLRINYFRAMAGVPADIILSPQYNRMAQAAALMMSRNHEANHTPLPDWQCYSQEGAMAAGRSNLFLGVTGPTAVSGYVEDSGSSNFAVGHRRWILCPSSRAFGTGDVARDTDNGFASANALWVIDGSSRYVPPRAMRDGFVAWPPPGYVPQPLVFPRWSFSYPDADFTAATVTMSTDGRPVEVTVAPLAFGYCANTLVWSPNATWHSLDTDRTYHVRIEHVQIEGQPKSFDYSVTIFDPS